MSSRYNSPNMVKVHVIKEEDVGKVTLTTNKGMVLDIGPICKSQVGLEVRVADEFYRRIAA